MNVSEHYCSPGVYEVPADALDGRFIAGSLKQNKTLFLSHFTCSQLCVDERSVLLCADVTDADDVVKLGKTGCVVCCSVIAAINVVIRHISGVVRYVPLSLFLSLSLYQPKHLSPI